MARNFVAEEPTLAVTTLRKFVAKRLSSVYSAEETAWRPQI
jgi:hypothetical protein